MTKREGLRAVVFLGIFLFLLVTITYCIRTNGDTKDRLNNFYAEKDNSIDVLMVGSSPIYPFYSGPGMYEAYGFAAHPLSTSNQRARAIEYLIKEAQKTQDPAVYVIELRMFSYPETEWDDTAMIRGVTDNMKYSWNRIQTINALVMKPEERYTYYFDIFKYHSNWKTLVLPSQLACWRYEKKDPLKGLVINTGVGPVEHQDYASVTDCTPMQDIQEGVLRELLAYLKAQGKEALFIVSPFEHDREEREQFNYMRQIIEAEGFPMLDMNLCLEEIGIDFGADFYDYGSHVNALGQAKCTAYLGNYLKEHYNLPDHRGEKAYTSWDAAAAEYRRQQDEAEKTCLENLANENWAPHVAE